MQRHTQRRSQRHKNGTIVRLQPSEYKTLRQAAQSEGYPLSDYLAVAAMERASKRDAAQTKLKRVAGHLEVVLRLAQEQGDQQIAEKVGAALSECVFSDPEKGLNADTKYGRYQRGRAKHFGDSARMRQQAA